MMRGKIEVKERGKEEGRTGGGRGERSKRREPEKNLGLHVTIIYRHESMVGGLGCDTSDQPAIHEVSITSSLG